MAQRKTTPWIKIKAEYLQGATPKELADKYNLTAKQVTNKANRDKWVTEKEIIQDKTRESIENKIQTYSNEAIEVLREVMNGYETENKDKVSAAKAILDISGLKRSKQETEIKGDLNCAVQQGFESAEAFTEHFLKMIGKLNVPS